MKNLPLNLVLIVLLLFMGHGVSRETQSVTVERIDEAVAAVATSEIGRVTTEALRYLVTIDIRETLANEIPPNQLNYSAAKVNENGMISVPTVSGEFTFYFFFSGDGELQAAFLEKVFSTEKRGSHLYRKANTTNLLIGLGLAAATRTKLDANGEPVGEPEILSMTEFLPWDDDTLTEIITPRYVAAEPPPFETPHEE